MNSCTKAQLVLIVLKTLCYDAKVFLESTKYAYASMCIYIRVYTFNALLIRHVNPNPRNYKARRISLHLDYILSGSDVHRLLQANCVS